MSLGISLAGFPLLLEDPDGKVQKWVNDWLPLDDLRAVTTWQRSPWSTWNNPSLNYSEPLRPKINTWYRPVGASRWAFGLFLADTQTKNAIVSVQGAVNSGTQLVLSHGTISRAWLCYVLPPRPISADVGYDSGLWILPVVDERYFWQFVSSGQLITDTTTWEDLMQGFATALGITLTIDAISSDYGTPNVATFNAGVYSNAAVMLDAAAISVGQRIVLDYQAAGGGAYFEEVYRSCSWSTSNSKRSYNLSLQHPEGSMQTGILSGSSAGFSAITPEWIDVVFRKWDSGNIVAPTYFYVSRQNATSYIDTGYTSGRGLTINSTALGDVSGLAWSTDPTNKSTLDSLAAQIATDFYSSLGWFSDQNYIGIPGYIETGFDDYVEFSVGRVRDDGSYALKTRVHTQPHNFGTQVLLHQVVNTHEYGQVVEGKLDGPVTPGGSATLSVWEFGSVAGAPGDSGRNVTVRDRLQWDIPAGAWVVAVSVNYEWRIVSASCEAV